MWQRLYPGSLVPTTNAASLNVMVFGRYGDAVADAEEAVRLGPYSSVAMRMLVLSYLGSNRVADAKRALREGAARGIADAVWHETAYQIATYDGDLAAAEAEARWRDQRPATAVNLAADRALQAAAAGRLVAARRYWEAAAAGATRVFPPIRQARIRLWEAEAEALLGDPARARRAAEAAVALHPQPATMLDAAASMTLAGDAPRASAFRERAATSGT